MIDSLLNVAYLFPIAVCLQKIEIILESLRLDATSVTLQWIMLIVEIAGPQR